ncbi:MAG: RNA methyltransferase [Bacteroidetes bacterium HGW-Bacteroidetes-21]|nr:MAG: RNA methyltransferase [Bacteroidetes bacterium HGW-Bacteroidetes-21]
MKKLSMEDLNRLSVQDFKKAEKIPVMVLLDDIRSQHNIGSVFRTSDAFRISHIFLCGITATPPSREIQKSALGATESVDWSYHESALNLINELKENGYKIVSVEQAENSIVPDKFSASETERIVLVFGNEVKGVQQEIINRSDYCIEIPQFGTKHSFNVSVTAGIVLWEVFKKMWVK